MRAIGEEMGEEKGKRRSTFYVLRSTSYLEDCESHVARRSSLVARRAFLAFCLLLFASIVFEKNIFQFGRQAPSEQFKNKLVLRALGARSLQFQSGRLVHSFKDKLVLGALGARSLQFQSGRLVHSFKNKLVLRALGARTSHNLFLKLYSSAFSASGIDVQIVASVDKRRVFVGEQIELTYRLLTRNHVQSVEAQSRSQYINFWIEDSQHSVREERTVAIQGREYREVIFERVLLYPTVAGKLRIDPVSFSIRAYPQSDILNPFPAAKLLICETKPIVIEALPLPERGRDDCFNGAVGDYSIASQVSSTKTRVGTPVTLQIKITGRGNIAALAIPHIQTVEGAKVYDPKIVKSETEPVMPGRIRGGAVTWESQIVPTRKGKVYLPRIRFCYFDPQESRYITKQTEPITLTVDEAGINPIVDQGPLQSLPETDAKPVGITAILSGKVIYQTVVAVGLGVSLFFAVWLLRRQRLKPAADSAVGPLALRQAQRGNLLDTSQLEEIFRSAENCLNRFNSKGFYDELAKALEMVLKASYGLSSSQFTLERIEQTLRQHRLDPGLIAQAVELYQICEEARFIPKSHLGREREHLRAMKRLADCLLKAEGSLTGRCATPAAPPDRA